MRHPDESPEPQVRNLAGGNVVIDRGSSHPQGQGGLVDREE